MNKKKLIELFIYVAVVVIGIILLITSNNDKKEICNFAAIKCLVVDVSCAEDSMEDFCIALES